MKTFFTAIIASVALAGIAAAGTVNFSNFGSTWEIQASGTPINGGFVSVGTTGVSDFSDAAAAQTALAADFTAFGASTDFGGAAAFNIDGFFSGVGQANGGDVAFDGKNIIIVGGDGTDIASSSHLFVIDTGAAFAADAPLFAANVDINTGALLGAAGGTAVAAGVAGAFQAVAVGAVIPEPGVSVLALFAVGFLALRRRR
jgi:hypothetical protein